MPRKKKVDPNEHEAKLFVGIERLLRDGLNEEQIMSLSDDEIIDYIHGLSFEEQQAEIQELMKRLMDE